MSDKTHQQIVLILQATPYYPELEQIEKDHHAIVQPVLQHTSELLRAFRKETRAGNTNGARECQDTLDENIKVIIDAYERNKREWNKVMARLGEDIGGILGKTLVDVAKGLDERGTSPAGSDMNLQRVLVQVARRMHAEE
ncbi:uncharacterized protein EAF01_002974 [Botrytis porri]|uniref:Uncharacterized protein n=1 Tax=Botrytis porri TaxID=87229 RepID=A0A4Z1K856_9HELO|nr:uncharacterized protein EAF01_002974 [Botrytis porri]KAF7911467.1 hypothetical protein EAF01_002974 [Botrytis porri]TGO82283.1 hypothetical protein BPOR_0872g00040 [Botrytis porri]